MHLYQVQWVHQKINHQKYLKQYLMGQVRPQIHFQFGCGDSGNISYGCYMAMEDISLRVIGIMYSMG